MRSFPNPPAPHPPCQRTWLSWCEMPSAPLILSYPSQYMALKGTSRHS
jgi:hypothetical protein